jgi:hypothetical protein
MPLFLGSSEEYLEIRASRARMYGLDDALLATMPSAAPELAYAILSEARAEHGDVNAYLRHHGLTGEEIEILRRELLDESPPRP